MSNIFYQRCAKCNKFIYRKVKRFHWLCNSCGHHFNWSKENLVISERDLQSLIQIHLRNPDDGYVANGENAEMYCIPASVIDTLVFRQIYQ